MNTEYYFKAYIYDNEWIVEYPDLRVIGTGETFEEAYKNAKVAKKEYIENLVKLNFPMPKHDRQEEDIKQLKTKAKSLEELKGYLNVLVEIADKM